MSDALFWHRLQFAFTVTYHYLFPQLTMGLALLIVILKTQAMRSGQVRYADAARFWAKIFGLTFAVGVVTGIPLEFQFGTNWSRFSKFSGGVIGQTLGMEGTFAFFLESTTLGLFLYAEDKLGPRRHLAVAVALWLGSWLSGYFIIATNAFMQHPTGYVIAPDGSLQLASFWGFVLNRWALWEYLHNMCAAVVTGSFAVTATAAYWALSEKHEEQAALNLRLGVTIALVACLLQIFPTGDRQGRMVADEQPVALAAMEGLYHGGEHVPLAIIGQPDSSRRELENPIVVPGALSFLAYGTFGSTVRGIDDFPADQRPDNVELLYYAYHVMVGLGTLLLALAGLAAIQAWRGRLAKSRPLLWALLLAAPLPYIANTAGWLTAEVGRQPWLIYGLMRTAHGSSPQVSAGDAIFTLLGFCGLYLIVGLAYLYLVGREIAHGPAATGPATPRVMAEAA
jgi:cytochrome d ubiquinol oxidase subunit I